jgi:hypothetical protein
VATGHCLADRRYRIHTIEAAQEHLAADMAQQIFLPLVWSLELL